MLPAPQKAVAPPAADGQAALREHWRAGEHRLAVAQQEALEGVPEAELAAALANFAEIHRQSLDEAAALSLRLNEAASEAAVRPEVAAAQARFAAIRLALAEQAISLEEAEVRFPSVSSPP